MAPACLSARSLALLLAALVAATAAAAPAARASVVPSVAERAASARGAHALGEALLAVVRATLQGEDADLRQPVSPPELREYLLKAEGKLVDAARLAALFRSLDSDADGELSAADLSALLLARTAAGVAGASAASPLDEMLPSNNTPVEVHLSLTGQASQMRVMWVSATNYSSAPQVRFGQSPGNMSSTALGSSSTYNVGLFGFHGTIYSVVLEGLEPSTVYHYSCGGDGAWSPTLSFTSPPPPRAPANLSFGIIADMGVVPLGWIVMRQLLAAHAERPFDLLLLAGDLAYAGMTDTGEVEPTWDVWQQMLEPLTQRVPFMTVVGNHEKYYNYTSFLHRFLMPGAPSPSNPSGSFWFSFDVGPVHFAAFSTEHPYDPASEQYAFLAADLAAAAAAEGTEWLVLTGHRPLLSSDADEYDTHCPGAPMLTDLYPLLVKYGVDLVITGHMHCYERAFLGNASSNSTYSEPGEPVFVVQGTAGALILEKWIEPQPAWSAARAQAYGIGRMDVTPPAADGTVSLHYVFSSTHHGDLDNFSIVKPAKRVGQRGALW